MLRQLVEYAQSRSEVDPPFHRDLEFRWQLDLELGPDWSVKAGSLIPLETLDERGRSRGVHRTTPAATRTVGVAANLAADDIQYVLGWADESSKPERVAKCHAAFVELTRRWAADPAAKDDPLVQALAKFYATPVADRVKRPEAFSTKDRVLVSINGQMLFERPSVVPFWTAEVARRKGGGQTGLCLVCGTVGPLLNTVPGKIPGRLLPGASNDAALVSVNEPVFGYDLSKQLEHTPICMTCGEAVSTGLLAILEGTGTTHDGQDSRTAWWIVGDSDFDPMDMLDRADPQEVTAFLGRFTRGRPPAAINQLGSFFSLTVGGNVARVMVRDWVEMPLEHLEGNVFRWFTHHEVASVYQNGRRHHSLYALVLASGRWDRKRNQYVDMRDRAADRPHDLRRQLHRAAIRDERISPALLAHLLHRISTDGRLDDARAALIRLYLTRYDQNSREQPPMPDLDTTDHDPAYVAGRLFAALEQIQHDASDGGLNATYADRHFSGALTSPRTAIVAGRKDATAWLKKLRQKKRLGAAVNHDKRLTELLSMIPPEQDLPARANMRQQARFILGYHHERAHHFASVRTRAEQRAAQSDQTAP